MVQTVKQGKKRPFSRGLLLTIVTFGIYGFYWAYKAPKELYDQFELQQAGRDDGVVWLILGLLLPFLIFVYFWKAVENVGYIKKRLGQRPDISPIGFIGLNLGAPAVTFLFVVVALVVGGVGAGSAANPSTWVGGMLALIALGFLIGLGMQLYAYHQLQGDINDAWDGWASRMDELTGPGDRLAPEGPPGRPVHGDPSQDPGP